MKLNEYFKLRIRLTGNVRRTVDRMYGRNGSCSMCSGVLHMGGTPIQMTMNM